MRNKSQSRYGSSCLSRDETSIIPIVTCSSMPLELEASLNSLLSAPDEVMGSSEDRYSISSIQVSSRLPAKKPKKPNQRLKLAFEPRALLDGIDVDLCRSSQEDDPQL